MKKQNLILSAVLAVVFFSFNGFAEAEVTGKIVHESVKFTTTGTTIGAAAAHDKDVVSPEFSASILDISRYPRAFNPKTGNLLFSNISEDSFSLNLVDYKSMGLESFMSGRSQRDLRSVDLNNDGMLDVLSNIYGLSGCFEIKKGLSSDATKLKFSNVDFKLWNRGRKAVINCLGGYGETISIADYDGDGLIDLLLPAYERVYLFKNIGNFEFEDVTPDFLILTDKVPRVEGAAFVDINSDGFIDIVVSDVIALNNGSGVFDNMTLPATYKVADEGILPIDLDNDKYFEIVKLDPSGALYIYKFSEKNILHLHKKIVLSKLLSIEQLHSTFGLSSADYNSDGCEDLVIAGGKPGSHGPILLINDCKMNFYPIITPNVNGFFSAMVLAGDFNNDGKPDIINSVIPLSPPSIKFNPNFQPHPFSHKVASEKTLILTNTSDNANNFKFTFTSYDGIHNLYGHSFVVTSAGENEHNSKHKMYFIDGGSGYMQQGSYSKLMYLDPKKCPYEIEMNTSNKTTSYTLACDGTYSQTMKEKSSSDVNLHITGSFLEHNKNSVINGDFLFDGYGWLPGDAGIVKTESDGGLQLINGEDNKWSFIRQSFTVEKGKRYKLSVRASPVSTSASIRLGVGGNWIYKRGEQINEQLDFTFVANHNSLTVDIFNTSPGKGLKSVIREIKVIKISAQE